MMSNHDRLVKLAHAKMPFGKYKDRYLIDLPEQYVIWYRNKGFPNGLLGEQLEIVYELKVNGLEQILRKIKEMTSN